MKIKIKKIAENCVLPTRSNPDDAGLDCVATSVNVTEDFIEYGLGFQVEIPKGYFGALAPRSSITKYDLMVKNSIGIIDSGYRGEVKLRTMPFGEKVYKAGDRVCQLIILPLPEVEIVEVDELDVENDRLGGFGSTGH